MKTQMRTKRGDQNEARECSILTRKHLVFVSYFRHRSQWRVATSYKCTSTAHCIRNTCCRHVVVMPVVASCIILYRASKMSTGKGILNHQTQTLGASISLVGFPLQRPQSLPCFCLEQVPNSLIEGCQYKGMSKYS